MYKIYKNHLKIGKSVVLLGANAAGLHTKRESFKSWKTTQENKVKKLSHKRNKRVNYFRLFIPSLI